jgi:hypothetical protein
MFDDIIPGGTILTEAETSQLKNYFIMIIDESGSMTIMKDEVVKLISEQVETVEESASKMQTEIWLRKFNSKPGKLIKLNKKFDLKTLLDSYNPSGMTALYDTIGFTLDELMLQSDIHDKNTSVLCIIITDGMENASKEYHDSIIGARIKELETTGRFTFAYLGTDHDVREQTQSLGIPMASSMTYTNSAEGIYTCSNITSENIRSFYGARATDKNFTGTSAFFDDSKLYTSKAPDESK